MSAARFVTSCYVWKEYKNTSAQDVTQNQTKGPGDWFHIAVVWDLGVGLAGRQLCCPISVRLAEID